MTEKQKRFADEYLVDLNATQSAIRAGYSKKTARSMGQRLLTFVDIKLYIEERLKEVKNENIAEITEIMEYLTSVMRGEQKDQTLRMIGDGIQEIQNIRVSSKDRIKSAELLGKRYGMFDSKVQVEGVVPIVIKEDIDE